MKRKFCIYSIYSSHDHSFRLLILLTRLKIQRRLNVKCKWSRDSRTDRPMITPSHRAKVCTIWGVVSRSSFTQLHEANMFNERNSNNNVRFNPSIASLLHSAYSMLKITSSFYSVRMLHRRLPVGNVSCISVF